MYTSSGLHSNPISSFYILRYIKIMRDEKRKVNFNSIPKLYSLAGKMCIPHFRGMYWHGPVCGHSSPIVKTLVITWS